MTEGEPAASGSEGLRRRNTAIVLRALRAGPASRAEVAARTGLAKATVGAIVAELESVGALAEVGTRVGARGRPARPVALAGSRFLGLGLEVNVDYVAVVVLDLAGTRRHHETRPVPVGASPLVELESLAAATARRVSGEGGQLVAAVVAVPGLVRDDDRTVAWAPNLDIAGDQVATRVGDALATVGTPCRVQVSNDADCSAYAEAHHGAATDTSSLLYLTGTVGIGAGIVDGGVLVRGGEGFAGEVGHMPVGDPDAVCGCGRPGCWEASVGLHGMLRAVAMPELGTPLATAAAVAARAAIDPSVRAGLVAVGEDVGRGLAVLANVLNPSVVVLGGYFVPLGDLVLDPARDLLHRRVVGPGPPPELRPGALGIEAAALGAAERAFAAVLAGDQDLPVPR